MTLERAEWGSDLPSVELQLETQQHIHTSVEALGSSVKEARLSEVHSLRNLQEFWGGGCTGRCVNTAASEKEEALKNKV